MVKKTARFTLLIAALSGLGRADIGPPPGLKGVPYSFTVEGFDATGPLALVAHPCGADDSNTPGFIRISPGKPIRPGRRSGMCELHALPRTELDAWLASHKGLTEANFDAATKLMTGPKVVRCKGAPTLTRIIPEGDPRTEVREVLRVTRLDATACEVAAPTGAPAAASSAAPAAAPPPSAPATASASGAPATPTPAPTAQPRGCAGCDVGATSARSGGAAVAVGALALLAVRRRRRR